VSKIENKDLNAGQYLKLQIFLKYHFMISVEKEVLLKN
jgi:hypothetical protein